MNSNVKSWLSTTNTRGSQDCISPVERNPIALIPHSKRELFYSGVRQSSVTKHLNWQLFLLRFELDLSKMLFMCIWLARLLVLLLAVRLGAGAIISSASVVM